MSQTPNTLVLEENARAMERWSQARKELEAFEAQHRELLRHHRHLTEQMEAARDAIEKLARSQVISLGPVTLKQTYWKVDAPKLAQALGEARFREIGGAFETSPKMSIATLRAAEKKGQISSEEVQAYIQPTHTFTVAGKVTE